MRRTGLNSVEISRFLNWRISWHSRLTRPPERIQKKNCLVWGIKRAELLPRVGMDLMEGAMRLGSKEYRQFVGIARGSAGEVCYQLLLARDLKYISNETYRELRTGYDRVVQMLSRLSQSLADEPRPRSRFTITALGRILAGIAR
jgi:hypothetical protein